MTSLTDLAINATYKDLLQISNSNSGIDTTVRDLQDGEGTVGPVEMSTTKFGLKGNDLLFDTDQDTYMNANTDDTLDLYIAGAKDFTWTANLFNVLAGSVLKVTGVETLTQATVASATALLVNVNGNIFDVTGTTTITSFATKGVGTIIILKFAAALSLEHDGTNIILPGAAHITTVAGDTAIFYEYGSGTWRCISYQRAADFAGSAVLDDLTTLGAAATDGEFIVATGAGAFAYEAGATARTSMGVAIGTNVQAFGAVLDDLNTLGANAADSEFLVGTAAGALAWESGATVRTSLGLTIGTDVQAENAVLTDLAALSAVADNEIIVGTGAGAYAHESGATARTSLGLAIGTDVQAENAVLTDLAALSPVADNEVIVGTGAGTYAHESGDTLRTSLGLAIGTDVLAQSDGTGRFIAVSYHTDVGAGTHTRTSGAGSALLQLVGGGGGGGGPTTGGTKRGGGGGGGEYSSSWIAVLGASTSFVIGDGGAAGAGGGNAGTKGDDTTWASTVVTAIGGNGGSGGSGAHASGGTGGTSDFSIRGLNGGQGSGASGDPPFGHGGGAGFGFGNGATSTGGVGVAGGLYGGGGGGGIPDNAGGKGAPGIIIVWEYS